MDLIEKIERGSDSQFPFLGIFEEYNLIVLFDKNNEGLVLSSGSSAHEIGEYSVLWDMRCFKQFEGTLTYKQEN